MTENLIAANGQIGNLQVRPANTGLVFRFALLRQLIGKLLTEISEVGEESVDV